MCDDPTCEACTTTAKADALAKPFVDKLKDIIKKESIQAAGIEGPMGPFVQMRALVTVLAEFCASAPENIRTQVVARVFHDLGDLYNDMMPDGSLGVHVEEVTREVDINDIALPNTLH